VVPLNPGDIRHIDRVSKLRVKSTACDLSLSSKSNRSRGERPCFQGFGEEMMVFEDRKMPDRLEQPLVFKQFTL
jgi:hypothetical protein